MITDSKLIFSDAQTQTTATSHDSTYYLDTQEANSDLGSGTPLWVVCQVSSSLTCALTCADFQVKLYSSDDASTWTEVLASKDYDYGECKKGFDLLTVALPPTHGRYLKLKYVITNAVLTTGKWDAYLSLNPPNQNIVKR